MAVSTLMRVATPKFLAALFSNGRSSIAMANPMPIMGPINGDMSMAPMMTAVEFTFRPREAMNMANINTHRLAPLKETPPVICSTISASSSMSCLMTK